jgi:hypothetical protein
MGAWAILSLLAFAARSDPGVETPPPADVELLAATTIAWDATDKSGLTGAMGGSEIPANRLGSFGSGLSYTGTGNTFLALSDRGPKDGAVDYVTRFHTLSIELHPADAQAKARLQISLLATTLFKNQDSATYTGLASAFDQEHPLTERRFDPEAIAVAPTGTVFTSDEYGP